MPTSLWTPDHTTRARQFWDTYQKNHDLTALTGHTAGIDPENGRVWVGETAEDILAQLEAEGLRTPLYFVRIGFDHYFRRGGVCR